MAAVLGLRGSGAFTTDERPKNWREMILYLFPNGEAPLTALLSMLKSQPTDDPSFNWWEKRLPGQRLQVNGNQASSVTNIVVYGTGLGPANTGNFPMAAAVNGGAKDAVL